MKQLLISISFLFLFISPSIGQDSISNKKSIFFDGVQLENPTYKFEWSFKIGDLPAEKFKNYQINKPKFLSAWTLIKFDSAFFYGFYFKRVIVKVTKIKNSDQVRMREFIGVVDLETLDKMTSFFNYSWEGWLSYPKPNPVYIFRLFKNKKECGIVINGN